tara:strand:+ start:2032 stop:2262 length:231 start_codon:yes stop_codon:yes gene_type:complete
MTLSEQMESMMDEVRAIKLLTKSISKEMESDVSVNGVKKIANLMTMIEGLKVPDIVCQFEEVDGMDYFENTQSGMA